jgi:hypothetical protein
VITSELQQLRGHVTSEMKAAPLVGRVAPTRELTLTVGLVVDNDALTKAATQVSDPQSPTYRQYLTAEQVGDASGVGPSKLIDALLPLPIVHPHLGGLGGPDPTIILVGVGGMTEVLPGIASGGPISYHED